MKKRVRIYKASDGEGKFINKTAQFLNKAQEGGMPDINMRGYPGSNQQQLQEMSNDQLASIVATSINNSEPLENIVMSLVTVHGKDPMEAKQFVDQIYTYLEQQSQQETEDDSDENPKELISEEIDPNKVMLDQQQKQLDDEMSDNAEAEAYEQTIVDDYDDNDDINAGADLFMNRGGSIPSKRSYVANVLKLAKKEAGGNSKNSTSNVSQEDNADPTGANVRKKALDKFIGSIKDESSNALAKEKAEKEYDEMVQQQQLADQYPMEQMYPDNEQGYPLNAFTGNSYDDYDGYQDDLEQAQFGGFFKRMAERKRARNATPRSFEHMQGMPGFDIDVRRTGLFGRPKEYSIHFDGMSPMPGMGRPGVTYNDAGYKSTTRKFSAVRTVVAAAEAKNKEATKEVATVTPTAATVKSADDAKTTTEVSTTPGKEATITIGETTTVVPGSTIKPETEIETPSAVAPILSPSAQYMHDQLTLSEKPFNPKDLYNPYTGPLNTETNLESGPFNIGGSVNNLFEDQYGNLQQYFTGGDEDFTQNDLDDVYSKNTANGNFPMAQFGGGKLNSYVNRRYGQDLYGNNFPNYNTPDYTKVKKGPYDSETGKLLTDLEKENVRSGYTPQNGMGIKEIRVDKTRLFSNVPKKYTVTYGQYGNNGKPNVTYGSDIKNPNNTSVNNQKDLSNNADISFLNQMKINRQNKQREREDRRASRQYPEYMSDNDSNENIQTQVLDGVTPFKNTEIDNYKGDIGKFYNKRFVPSFDNQMEYGGNLQNFLPKAQDAGQYPDFSKPGKFVNGKWMTGPDINWRTDKEINQTPANLPNPFGQKVQTDFSAAGTEAYNPWAADTPLTKVSDTFNNDQSNQQNDFSMDFKTKRNIDGEDAVNAGLTGLTGVTGLLNRRDAVNAERKMYDNLTPDNMIASKSSLDIGDYETNSGLFKPDDMGSNWNGGSAQYGGTIVDEDYHMMPDGTMMSGAYHNNNSYQDGGMTEGDERYMNEEEIEEFLANGGDLEFI